MERKNILFLTLCVGHQTEFQGGVREGRFTKCEKDVVFELKARDETFGWCAHTHIHTHTYTHVKNSSCIAFYFEMGLGGIIVRQPPLIGLFFFLHLREQTH